MKAWIQEKRHDRFLMCRVDTTAQSEQLRLTIATNSATMRLRLTEAFDTLGRFKCKVGRPPTGRLERLLQVWLEALLSK